MASANPMTPQRGPPDAEGGEGTAPPVAAPAAGAEVFGRPSALLAWRRPY